jgi:hypothetical protein
VTFDSDGQHGTADIARLLDPLKAGTHDVVLGSRFAPGGDVRNIGWLKRVTLRLAVAFTRLTTGLAVTDTHNGLRALSSAAAARIKITHNHMAHASELLAQIGQAGLRYCEIPVTITYTDYSRAKGQSVLNSVNILWDILRSKIR